MSFLSNIFSPKTTYTPSSSSQPERFSPDMETQLKRCLEQLHCNLTVCDIKDSDNKAADQHYYKFTFQGGHFIAQSYKGNVVQITMPVVHSADNEYLNCVRAACNEFNNNCLLHTFVYTIDDEDHDVRSHIIATLDDVSTTKLSWVLEAFFDVKRNYCEMVDELIKRPTYTNHDMELHSVINKNELRAFREMEILHGKAPVASPEFLGKDGFVLDDFMNLAFPTRAKDYLRLSVMADGQLITIEDKDEIKHMPLYLFLINHDTEKNELDFKCKLNVMVVDFIDMDDTSKQVVIKLEQKDKTDTTLYYKATTIVDEPDVDRYRADQPLPHHDAPFSVMLAIDQLSAKRKEQEANYYWKEAFDKAEEGSEMDDDERVLAAITSSYSANCYYWAKRYKLNGMYVQALKLFSNAYYSELKKTNGKVTDAISELAYEIGFCYCELKMYERAFSYLHLAKGNNSLNFIMEFINCLSNSKDPRDLFYINYYLNQVTDVMERNDDGDNLQAFFKFLLRRHAYCLINHNELDQAEVELKQLVKDEDCKGFALHELEIIKKLREFIEENSKQQPEDKD